MKKLKLVNKGEDKADIKLKCMTRTEISGHGRSICGMLHGE